MRLQKLLPMKEHEIDLDLAMEVAAVGIMPGSRKDPVGTTIKLAGQTFTVIGYATQEEFIQAYQSVETRYPIGTYDFDSLPPDLHYMKIITD